MEGRKGKESASTSSPLKNNPRTDAGSPSSMVKSRSSKPVPSLFKDDSAAAGQRGKRRRTSPQDHSVLEAAYLKNSKPAKHERAQIVNEVHLGEKEVQIWFQNRRQNDRRRSKPSHAYELVANTKPQTPLSTSDHPKFDEEDFDNSCLSASHHAHPSPALSDNRPQPSLHRSPNVNSIVDPLPQDRPLPQDTEGLSTPPLSTDDKSAQVLEQEFTPISRSKTEGSAPGSGRKRDHTEMFGNDVAPEANPIPTKPKESLKRSSSVRLSMTAEGAVKIRTSNDPTPSPPKARPLPPTRAQTSQAKIRRSVSLFEDLDAQQPDQPSKPRLLNAGFGRSRDARTWEFYCDNSARDALSTQVEAECNGSAIGAINLIRSNSQKSRGFPSPMSPALSKGNVQLGAIKSKTGKPKMMRAKSSLARLQSSEEAVSVLKQSSKQTGHVRSPSGDSDKENWAPGTRISDNPLRRTQPTNNRRPVLQSNESATFPDARPQSNTAGKASTIKPTAGGDDLDCIQGLLSLSQGAWR